ncbi:fumarylacetoacetate hydrolase family protein [Herbaspirillum sp. C7C8]|uniref:fumarylacetoacetate hydrolase family protein n=1 Tax=Herbaspirillum sp. C7C8 TaxID=2736665 RepID=UPI001F51B443|nr:fumarylacetoacetate hydrolase family protein [Herbaspirillum sp. C7C8]MCI1006136.1 fumarylacetoacetate hydrolase family protein [Herbaspirillum sp. C7C8]
MKFATLRDGSPDGALVLVARDAATALPVSQIARTLIDALARWDEVKPALTERYEALNEGRAEGVISFDAQLCMAPLPRAPQWLDASAFLNHGRLMEEAFKTPPIPYFDTVPVMYQGASDDFLGPQQDVPLRSEAEGIDFEGEFGVVVGPVAMGATPDEALQAVRLVVQLNDWSLRALGPHEMKTGFGFLQAKPSTAFAPIAVTPDELGMAWRDGRVHMHLHVQWNGARFGEPHGGEMNFSFGQLIAHAAHSRRLTAGCIIGSGTVSNVARAAGSACIAERRVIEKIDHGEIRTGFMHFGDEVRMQAHYEDGSAGPFGIVQQRVVRAA